MAVVMPLQQPGRSRQDHRTPPEFLAAAKHKLGIEAFAIDLAADEDNSVADWWYDQAQDSLQQPWHKIPGWQWLNPPFGKCQPWVEKAWRESAQGAQIAMLVPAAVGANWWRDFVHQRAFVWLLNGRITFVGQPTCYPKDCCLLLYGRTPSYAVWTWPRELSASAASAGGSRRAAAPAGRRRE